MTKTQRIRHVKMEAKIEVMQSQAKEHLEPPEVERGKEAFSTITLGERATLHLYR